MGSLRRPITNRGPEEVMFQTPKYSLGPDYFMGKFYQTFKENLI